MKHGLVISMAKLLALASLALAALGFPAQVAADERTAMQVCRAAAGA